jgi:hypothetical protein
MLCIGFVIIPIGFADSVFRAKQYDVGIAILVLGILPLAFLYYSERGYRVCWDDERLYVRSGGWTSSLRRPPVRSVDYDAIQQIEAGLAGDATLKSRFMLFDLLIIVPNNGDEELMIYLPLFRHVSEVKEFLTSLRNKRPDICPEVVSEFIDSGESP